MRVRQLDILRVANLLRSDPLIDWSNIVQKADWVKPKDVERVSWVAAWKDLSSRLPKALQEYLGWGDSVMDSKGFWIPTVIAMAEHAVGKPLDEMRTPKELELALQKVPGAYAPDLLFSLWRNKRVGRDGLRQVLPEVWRYTDSPSRFPAHQWRLLFQTAGFLSDGPPRPKRPLTVYRGCRPAARRGFSWTLRRLRAEWFADYWFNHGCSKVRGHVYKLRVKPSDVLAIILGHNISVPLLDGTTGKGGGEDEVVVDTRHLKPILVETWQQRIKRQAEEADSRRLERLKSRQRK